MSQPLCVMLVAAEASGDDRGAGLARALRARLGDRVRFVGVGGERMAAEGVQSPFDIAELSILDDQALYATWWEKIPVVLIDDRLHAHWRLDAARLRAALDAAASQAPDAISVSESTPAPAPEEDPA